MRWRRFGEHVTNVVLAVQKRQRTIHIHAAAKSFYAGHKDNPSTTASPQMRSLQEWQMCGDLNSPM